MFCFIPPLCFWFTAAFAAAKSGVSSAPVVQHVAVHALTLSSHTKLALDTVTIGLMGHHLCNVSHPAAFAAQLRRVMRHSSTVPYPSFRQDFVRMRVRVTYRDSTWVDLFLDKGGKYALFHRNVYRLRDNARLAQLLRRALPGDATGVIDPDLKRDYRKQDFSPME